MIFLALAAIIWGSSFPAITYSLRDTSPMLLLFLRFGLAFAILGVYGRVWRRGRHLFHRDIFLISIPNALSFILQFKAQELTTASKTALFVNSSPVFVAILIAVVLKERIQPRPLMATLVAMAGVVVTSTGLDLSSFSVINHGDFLAVLTGFSWAVFIVFARNVIKKYSPLELALGLYFWSTLFTMPFVIFEPARIAGSSVWATLYLAVVATVVGYYFYLKGARSVRPLTTSIVILVEVIVAFAISHGLLGESFSAIETVGVALVMTGVVMVLKR